MGLVEGRNLYSFDAVAYESVMLGCFEMLRNTPKDNADSDCAGLPKQTALHFGFSRDGVRYSFRPEADIEPSGWGSGKWDTGYLSALGGICTVGRDKLRFYYTGRRFGGTAGLRSLRAALCDTLQLLGLAVRPRRIARFRGGGRSGLSGIARSVGDAGLGIAGAWRGDNWREANLV